ncbi:MAG: DUF975 family protein [Clostridiales bacterium]|nr:DUF975 family protein [Clostridiales bacterium]
MPINRAELKANARGLMRTVRPSVFLAALITLVVSWILAWLTSRVTGMAALQQAVYSVQDPDAVERVFENYLANPRPFGQLIGLLLSIMTTIWSVGFTVFCLRATRGRPVAISNLMDGFTVFLRVLVLTILIGIFTFLWTLLFIIPGIIAAYRYSQSIYLLLDHPEMSPMQCMKESARLMRGHKWELFVLNLSFIGWALLTIVPLVSIWVSPYMELTYAEYYNRLAGWTPTTDAMPGTEAEDDRLV